MQNISKDTLESTSDNISLLLFPGNAVHLPLHHVVNPREEVRDQVKRNGEEATCGRDLMKLPDKNNNFRRT